MAIVRIVFEVQEAEGCPLYKPGDRLVFALPGVTAEGSKPVCAALVSTAYPLAQALAYGVPFEAVGAGTGDEGIFSCPGAGGRRAVFSVERKEEQAPTFTTMIGRKDKDVEFIIEHLKKISIFNPLPRESLEKMISVLELKRIQDGTSIITQGEPGEYLFILIKGKVDVIQVSEEGSETKLATLSKGEVFGEMSLISGEPCSATVKSNGSVSLLSVSKENFFKILDDNPSLNIYFNKLLVQRLRKQNVQVDEEIEKSVLGKLSMFTLPELAQTINMNGRTGTLILYNANLRGEILFKEGQVFDAILGELTGEEAFFALLAWNDGNFRFKPGEVDQPRNVSMDTMGLLMEGLRRLDEAKKLG